MKQRRRSPRWQPKFRDMRVMHKVTVREAADGDFCINTQFARSTANPNDEWMIGVLQRAIDSLQKKKESR